MSKFLARLIDGKRKIVLRISAFFAFIEEAVFPLPSFKARIFLNGNGLVYLNVV